MKKKLLVILVVTLACFIMPSLKLLQEKEIINKDNRIIDGINSMVSTEHDYPKSSISTLDEIKEMLLKEANTLNKAVVDKVLTTLKCVNKYNIQHNNILTIIDYSLPSSQKRLWVFDLQEKKLLFYTFVSHGINSGFLLSNSFSNKYNSKASSIGVYKTEQSYYGRDGISLRLDGLDQGFNDNASNRAVVMHGGWYVDEDFIKKYGRAGRSWGCPALPQHLTKSIINTIKDNSLFVMYYPSDNWFLKSKFLNCDKLSSSNQMGKLDSQVQPLMEENERQEDVLFARINNSKREDNEAIVVMTAERYESIFRTKVPLTRMLRRQINNIEYIALSNSEFQNMAKDNLNAVYFVVPVVKMQRGYYKTEMKIVNLGKIKEIRPAESSKTEQIKNFTVDFEAQPSINLRSTSRFIRWLGL